jgi:hypothetical protein
MYLSSAIVADQDAHAFGCGSGTALVREVACIVLLWCDTIGPAPRKNSKRPNRKER